MSICSQTSSFKKNFGWAETSPLKASPLHTDKWWNSLRQQTYVVPSVKVSRKFRPGLEKLNSQYFKGQFLKEPLYVMNGQLNLLYWICVGNVHGQFLPCCTMPVAWVCQSIEKGANSWTCSWTTPGWSSIDWWFFCVRIYLVLICS